MYNVFNSYCTTFVLSTQNKSRPVVSLAVVSCHKFLNYIVAKHVAKHVAKLHMLIQCTLLAII